MKPAAVIFSECTSKNLGDQAISRALNLILSPYFELEFVSFSGEKEPTSKVKIGDVSSGARISVLRRILRAIPPKIKARINWYFLGERNRLKKIYKKSIQGKDLVVIGGGQLIKNNTSLFCDRLLLLHGIVSGLNVPSAFVGVGVDRKMSMLTWRLVDGLVGRCKFMIFRDEISLRRIEKNLNINHACQVLPDIAFALDNYAFSDKPRQTLVGINVMSANTLLGGVDNEANVTCSDIIDGYCQAIECIQKKFLNCVIFTSGTVEDLAEANNIREIIKNKTGVEVPLFHPKSLDDLLDFLLDVRYVIAARMHVGILAYISGCSPICISWDDKVRGVWSVIGEEDRVIELTYFANRESAIRILDKLDSIEPPTHREITNLRRKVCLGITQEFVRFLGRDQRSNSLAG